MPIYAKDPSGQFPKAPPGSHPAVCCDVVDLGTVSTHFGTYPAVRIVWQIDETQPNGKRYLVMKRYKNSLHPKSGLSIALTSWRGRAFTDEERRGFDLEKLLGVNCIVSVTHKANDQGGVFVDVSSVSPPMRNQPRMEVEDYIRVCDRTTEAHAAPHSDDPTDNEVPF